MNEQRYEDGSIEAHAYWYGRGVQAHEGAKEIATLRAELERVTTERDALQDALDSAMSVFFGENVPEHYEPGHVAVHVMALVATIDQLRYERDAAEAERDAARAAAGAWKRSAKMWRREGIRGTQSEEYEFGSGRDYSDGYWYRQMRKANDD